MNVTKTGGLPRAVYAIIGVVVLLMAGFVYAWSLLSSPIGADFPEWSAAELSMTFTVCMTSFCLGGFVAGLIIKKTTARVNMIISAALFFGGFMLTSGIEDFMTLYISYGVMCGTASGFAYNAVLSVIPRYFPDKQGLISGALLMGFGASSMIIGSAFTALTPAEPFAWRGSFQVMAVIMGVLLFLASFFMKAPENQATTLKKSSVNSSSVDLSPQQMLKSSSFWFLFIWVVLMSILGLVVISQAKTMAELAGDGISVNTISLIVGMISICNGLGRLFFGGLFDKLGYKKTGYLINLTGFIGIACLFGATSLGNIVLVVAGFIFVGASYGGGPTMSAACTAYFFGRKNYPINFPIMNMSLMVASFASPIAGGLYESSGNFTTTLLLLTVGLAISAVIMKCINK